jgi:hypothetical protein
MSKDRGGWLGSRKLDKAEPIVDDGSVESWSVGAKAICQSLQKKSEERGRKREGWMDQGWGLFLSLSLSLSSQMFVGR